MVRIQQMHFDPVVQLDPTIDVCNAAKLQLLSDHSASTHQQNITSAVATRQCLGRTK